MVRKQTRARKENPPPSSPSSSSSTFDLSSSFLFPSTIRIPRQHVRPPMGGHHEVEEDVDIHGEDSNGDIERIHEHCRTQSGS